MKNKKLFYFIIFLLAVVGCAPIDQVKVITTSAPESCKFVGNVIGEDTRPASPQDIRLRRLNGLKYRALEKSANLVVLEPQLGATPHYSHSHKVLLGKAYICPANVETGLHVDPFSLPS